MKNTVITLVTFAAALALAACDKSGSGASPSGSASGTTASTAKPTTTAAATGTEKKPTTKLTGQQLQDAYQAASKETDQSKKMDIVKKALGDPMKTDGDKSIWWGWAPKNGNVDPDCIQLSLSPTKGNSVGGSDWTNCGMGG